MKKLILLLLLAVSLSPSQIRDNFNRADTSALTGQKKWVALGTSAPMKVVSNAAGASLATSGMNYSLWDSQMTSLTQFRFRIANVGTWLSGRSPILFLLSPTKSPTQGSGGFTLRGNLSGTSHQFRLYYRSMVTSIGGHGYTQFALPAGFTTLSNGDTLVLNMLSFYPMQFSFHRWRASGIRDSLGVATDTSVVLVNQLTNGFYPSIGALDSTNLTIDEYYSATIGAEINSPPSISFSQPASTADTGNTVTYSMTFSDGGAGAGVDRDTLWVDGAAVATGINLTGTTHTLTYSTVYHSAGTHTYYGTGRDDSLAWVREPASGTRSLTVNAPATGGGGEPTPTYGSIEKWYYLYGGELNMSGLGGTNGGRINVATFDWNLGDVFIAFGGSVSADGTLNLGGMLSGSGRTTTLNDYLHSKGKRILFLAGGSTNTEFATAQNDVVATQNLCHNIKLFMQNYHYDGFDIDLESGLNVSNMQRFVRILKDTMNTFYSYNDPSARCLITAFVYSSGLFNAFNGGGMDTCIDYYNLGSYDQAGTWQNLVWHISNPTTYDSSGNIPSYNLRPGVGDLLPSVHSFIKRAKSLGWPANKINAFYDFNGALWRGGINSADPSNGVYSIRQQWSSAPTIDGDYNYYNAYPLFIRPAELAGTIKHDSRAGYAPYIEFYHPELDINGLGVPDSVFVFADSISIRRFVQVCVAETINGGGAWDMGEGSLNVGSTRPHRMYEYLQSAVVAFTDTSTRGIANTSPSSATAGASGFTLTVNGENFHSGDSVFFGGTYRVTTFVSSAQLTAAILAADIAAAGSRSVLVRNAAVSSNTVYFTVNAATAKPELTSGSPATAGQGATARSIVWTGTGFQSGAAITFSGTGITVNSTTFNSTTSLTSSISVSSGASVGNRTVYITNPDGQLDTLVGGLAVTSSPTLTAVVPDSIRRGETRSVLITGNHFKNGTGVALSFSPSGISFSGGTFSSDSTRWNATIVVDGGASTGYRSITMTNGDGGTATLASAIRVYVPTDTSGSNSKPYSFVVREFGIPSTRSSLDYIDWNIKSSTQIGKPATDYVRQYYGGLISSSGDTTSTTFGLGLSSDGTLSGSPAYLADGEGFHWTLSGNTFTGAVNRANDGNYGSVIGNSSMGGSVSISGGVISLLPNSVSSANIAGQLSKSVLPYDAVYSSGAAGSIAVNNGDGTYTNVDTSALSGGASQGGAWLPNRRSFNFFGPNLSTGTTGTAINASATSTNYIQGVWKFVGVSDSTGTCGDYMGGVPADTSDPAHFITMWADSVNAARGAAARGIIFAPISSATSGYQVAGTLLRHRDTLLIDIKWPTSAPNNTFFVGKIDTILDQNVQQVGDKRIGIEANSGASLTDADSVYAVVCDGSAQTRVGIANLNAIAGTWTDQVKFEIGTSSVKFYIGGVLKATISTNLPAVNAPGGWVVSAINQADGTDKTEAVPTSAFSFANIEIWEQYR